MQTYANNAGNSGVTAFELGDDSITVEFKGGARYLYTNDSAGADHIQQMKALAEAGQGLSTYIRQHVHKRFASKL